MRKTVSLLLTLLFALSLTVAGNNEKKGKSPATKKAAKSCCEGMTSKDCSDKMPDCDPKDAKAKMKSGGAKSDTKSEVKTDAPKVDPE